MSKEQIEEMREMIHAEISKAVKSGLVTWTEFGDWLSEALYNAGYRKQSEPISCGHEKGGWISVDERLPKELTHIIVCDEDRTVGEALYLSANRFEWLSSEELAFVTHWIPLPVPPIVRKEDEGK